MEQLRDQMEADLTIGGYSQNTQKIYLLYARKFAAHFMRSPAEMGADEVRRFLLHLVRERKASRETIRQVRSSLRFLYTVTLNRPVEIEWLPVPRKPKRLPVVLGGTEVSALLDAVRGLKYRMVLSAMYAAGLRIAEACALRPEHIDSRRMVIRVCGKGDKERCTLLSERLLHELRDYWRRTRPASGWLFPGGTRAGHVGKETARKVFHKAVRAAGIAKAVTPHALRHIAACRTAALGGHVDECDDGCGYARISYNSCRDRHCPKCQEPQRAEWLQRRLERLLPVPYFHVVFTIPDALNPLALRNKAVVYGILFEAASKTLLEFTRDPKRLGADIGVTAVLHTWGQNLLLHPHLHCVVTA